jgi:hypothetical protein
VLILAWFLLGLSLLATETAILTLQAPAGSYVSIIGALQWTLLGAGSLPTSQWPWSQADVGGIVEHAAVAAVEAPIKDVANSGGPVAQTGNALGERLWDDTLGKLF